MEGLHEHIDRALVHEEVQAERIATYARFVFLGILTVVAGLNAGSVTASANTTNFVVLGTGYLYGLVTLFVTARYGYRPVVKYLTSAFDILLVYSLLVSYSLLEDTPPSVALKNYVFYITYIIIALSAFRYDRAHTVFTGGLAAGLYILLFVYATGVRGVQVSMGGYAGELFREEVTLVGQVTKIALLISFAVVMAVLAQYTHALMVKLVGSEVTLRLEKERSDRELQVAAEVQAALLPRSIASPVWLDVDGKAAEGTFVGGDYYDVIVRPGGSLFIIVADVSGSGVPAALIMSGVRGAVHVLANSSLGLKDLTGQLNTLLLGSTTKKDFVTALLAEFDRRDGTLRFVNAGHPPPLLFTGGSGRVVPERTIPLGLQAVLPEMELRTLPFPPGSMLVCCTDGLIERCNDAGEEYGMERLQRCAASLAGTTATGVTRGIFQDMQGFAGSPELLDDATLVVVRSTGLPASVDADRFP